jgi:hypothetical protein
MVICHDGIRIKDEIITSDISRNRCIASVIFVVYIFISFTVVIPTTGASTEWYILVINNTKIRMMNCLLITMKYNLQNSYTYPSVQFLQYLLSFRFLLGHLDMTNWWCISDVHEKGFFSIKCRFIAKWYLPIDSRNIISAKLSVDICTY